MSAAGTTLNGIPPMPLDLVREDIDAGSGRGMEAELVLTLDRRRAHLVRVAQRLTRCHQDAEDVVQESALKALSNLAHFRGESRMDTWLHAIVVNTARSWLRCRRNHGEVSLEMGATEDGEAQAMDFPHPGESPEDGCGQGELRRLLQAEIEKLNPMLRGPIELCDLREWSYREAAYALNLTDATIKARLFRGRTQLKRRLARHVRPRGARGSRGASAQGIGR